MSNINFSSAPSYSSPYDYDDGQPPSYTPVHTPAEDKKEQPLPPAIQSAPDNVKKAYDDAVKADNGAHKQTLEKLVESEAFKNLNDADKAEILSAHKDSPAARDAIAKALGDDGKLKGVLKLINCHGFGKLTEPQRAQLLNKYLTDDGFRKAIDRIVVNEEKGVNAINFSDLSADKQAHALDILYRYSNRRHDSDGWKINGKGDKAANQEKVLVQLWKVELSDLSFYGVDDSQFNKPGVPAQETALQSKRIYTFANGDKRLAGERTPINVGTYNMGGGAGYDYRAKYGQTQALVGYQMTHGTGIVGLQEVHVGRTQFSGKAAGDAGTDYNEQTLIHTYMQQADPALTAFEPGGGRRVSSTGDAIPSDGKARFKSIEVESLDGDSQNERGLGAYDPNKPNMRYTFTRFDGTKFTVDVRRETLDAAGNPTGSYDPNGQTTRYTFIRDGKPYPQQMTIKKESVAANGSPQMDPATGAPAYTPINTGGGKAQNQPDAHPITVYTATITNPSPGHEGGQKPAVFTLVYGESLNMQGGDASFGNAVLMGPGYELKRDAKGALLPGQVALEEVSNQPGKERRTAIGVKSMHNGKEVAFISTHLSTDQSAQDDEYKKLRAFSEGFGVSRAILVGDFNSKPGGRYWAGGIDFNTHPAMGMESSESEEPQRRNIDHILVSESFDVGGKRSLDSRESDDPQDQIGGSDHEYTYTTVYV